MESNNSVVARKSTLVRRVSDMFKDGNYSGPPLLFTQTSMEKIRHCCQNLNLSYFLYSFDNSKSHPIAKTISLYMSLLLKNIMDSIVFAYLLHRPKVLFSEKEDLEEIVEFEELKKEKLVEDQRKVVKFTKFVKEGKPKRNSSMFLIMAVYVTPVILALQVYGLFSMMIIEKYTPGFIFLISALFLLGFISLKVLVHDTVKVGFKCEKRKIQ